MLLPREKWRHYPAYENRAAWQRVPADVRDRILNTATGVTWPALPATLYLEYQRTGNRSRYEGVYRPKRAKLRELVVAECLEGKGRYLDDIANGIWSLCEETSWCLPAHISAQKAGVNLPDTSEPITDLFAADTASLLAWTDALVGQQLDRVSKLIRPRLQGEVQARVLDPCHQRNDFWWMGLDPKLQRTMNNWNPWINSNWLTAVLLIEPDSARRSADVWKIMTSLDRFVDSYHDDGGCDEGPGYWGHAGGSMFECLDLLRSATGGKLNLFDIPLVGEIGRYIYRVHIDRDWYVNFGDASARTNTKGDLIYRYGKSIQDPLMMRHGAYALSLDSNAGVSADSIARQLDGLFILDEIQRTDRRPPLIGDVWLPGTQHMVVRQTEGSNAGFFLAAQGGHNAESHNHNDAGNFVVFLNGQPVLIDIGVETYTAKTFSSRRYEIWTMQSAWHNLPTINGVMQRNGREAMAENCRYSAAGGVVTLTMSIAKAYPSDAGVRGWVRSFRFDRRAGEISINDDYTLTSVTGPLELNFITTCQITPGAAGELLLKSGGEAVAMLFDADTLTVQMDEHDSTDARLRPIWGDKVRRIRLIAKAPGVTGRFLTRFVRKTA